MSKANQALTSSVKKLLKGAGVKIMTYQELNSKVNFSIESLSGHPTLYQDMAKNKALHWEEMNLIAVDDEALISTEDTNELVLHELIHLTATKLGRIFEGEVGRQTEECIAQVGMFKLTLVLGLNPAPYADRTMEYIKQFPKANFRKVEIASDKAVEYLVRNIGMERVA